jgi:hypothetical protein
VQENGHSTRRTLARLAFANYMDRLVAGDRAPGSPEGAKMLACAYPSFDRPMILFQNIVEILHRSVLAILLKGTFGFETHGHSAYPPAIVRLKAEGALVDNCRHHIRITFWNRTTARSSDGSARVSTSDRFGPPGAPSPATRRSI